MSNTILQNNKRVRWMIQNIQDAFRMKELTAEEALKSNDNYLKKLTDFIQGTGPSKLFFFYQAHDSQDANDLKENPNDAVLFISEGDDEKEKLRDKAVYFLRMSPEGKPVSGDVYFDNDILFGEISNDIIAQLDIVVNNVYEPLIEGMSKDDWLEIDEESKEEFYVSTKKFAKDLGETLKSLKNGLKICTLNGESPSEKASERERSEFYVKKFEKWMEDITKNLNDESEQKREAPDAGPRTELDYWRARMQKITSLSEQFKTPDFNTVLKYLEAHKDSKSNRVEDLGRLISNYHHIDNQITDKLNEAKDNVKYLTTLEKFIEPLYTGTPQQIIDTLPALMNAIKMIHTIARYYNTTDKMTNLFVKITNQMITNCKQRLQPTAKNTDKIWEQKPEDLIQELNMCIKLNHAYQEQYKITKDKVADLPKGRHFDFAGTAIFGKFDLFCRRVSKLIEIFKTKQQFNALAKHNFEGIEEILKSFKVIIDGFRAKKYDLLEYTQTRFDRDFVEFNVKISGLDNDLQQFIESNFSRFSNIEYSLKLLKKFESILIRDSVRHNLNAKYNSVLQNYSAELSKIQRIFDDNQKNPVPVRNMPTEAGKIIWAKHLFQKITGPMIELKAVTSIQPSVLKSYYGNYNSLGKQLTIYEMWYFHEWCNNIERAKAGLQSTLIVRHEGQNKKLVVNFDYDIFQLIREAKCLERNHMSIPESARIILLQEEKFKTYYNELNYLLREYERIISKIKPITKNILGPHIEDLEFKIRPGLLTLTWTSMNIDAYLKHVHQGLSKLEQLIITVNDIIDNRIENNLKTISKVELVDLVTDGKPLDLDNFVQKQQNSIAEKTGLLMSKNVEVEHAIDDLIQTILLYPVDPHVDPVNLSEVSRIKSYYFWYLYQALLNSTQNSLNKMKHRICGKKGQGSITSLKPFFEVKITLDNRSSQVVLSPSLEDIQKAINKAATAVLRCSKNLINWNQENKPEDQKSSFYELIAQEKEIVKVILLLTGSIQGTKNKIAEELEKFTIFEWLWTRPIHKDIEEFSKTNPQIYHYEEKLRMFSKTENEIDQIDAAFNIGAMSLLTAPLKDGLKNWVKEWKIQYSSDLHKKARQLLDELTERIKELTKKANEEVKDIDTLGSVMNTLEEIRKMETEIDMKFGPVIEMYDLLTSFAQTNIPINLDTVEMDSRSVLRGNWESLVKLADKRVKELQTTQGKFLKELKEDVKTFIQNVSDFRKDYEINGPMVSFITPKEAKTRLHRFQEEYEVRHKKYEINKAGENLFGLKNQEYPALDKTDAELKNLKLLYDLYTKVTDEISNYKQTAWIDLTPENLMEMGDNITKLHQQCLGLKGDLRGWEAYKELKLEIENFKEILPIIESLKRPAIKNRHWDEICVLTKKNLNYQHEDAFTLSDIIEANLLQFKEDIEEIADSAVKQLKIEAQLKEVVEYWKDATFDFAQVARREGNPLLKGDKIAEIKEKFDEHLLTLSSLGANKNNKPFAVEIKNENDKLSEAAETLELWLKVQSLWANLEAVFMGGDIAKAMPVEAKKFLGIDKNWMKIMEKANESKKVIACCLNEVIKTPLPGLLDGLEACSKSLEAYLEEKKKLFPRFYFVSDPALLKILSQGSDPETIQSDFEKLFDAITEVTFAKADKKSNLKMITQIMSTVGKEKEIVELTNPVVCKDNIETWLNVLVDSMQESVGDIVRSAADVCRSLAIKDLEEGLINRFISQVALLGIQLIWTAKIEGALVAIKDNKEKQAYEMRKKEIKQMLDIMTDMCLKDLGTKMNRTKIETLVTIQVHQKSVTDKLKAKDVNDFEWQCQTRIYYTDNCYIKITDWDAAYNFEYLGSKERLCITPLTDRCYITLAQAMSMYYGGAPAGPAGTGKTETVKDLGRTLGVFVVVTNCSGEHRYKDMAKIFKGLCQSGLWGCFDEFNRIDLEVLSVVAQQVEAIGSAKKQHLKSFSFPGETKLIKLIDSVGYFITMNPGYAGRQELPENLKVLFRGVTMMVPQRDIIIQVKLASVGYRENEILSKKFTVLYYLCEQQLSKMRHYDFGLRNILSVLRTAGNTKRAEIASEEEMLLMRTLRDMNLSKLVADDVGLFSSLLKDLFPKQTDPAKKVYQEIESKIKELIPASPNYLIFHDSWVLKIIQLYETSLVRHGFMLVGPTGTGKSSIMKILTDAISETKIKTICTKMNPKAITSQEMYGQMVLDDWNPGIFSKIWEKSNDKKNKHSTWIVCDGPVDAIWIENLNTVLDDNKILTLANGDRFSMSELCKVVFEVENLNNASPATVSRCGIVFVSSTDLGFKPVYEGWLLKRRKENTTRGEECDKLNALFIKYFDQFKVHDFEEKEMKNQTMELATVCKVNQFLNLLTGAISPLAAVNKTPSEAEYEKIFLWCLSWAMAGTYESKERNQFHDWLVAKNAPVPPRGKDNETIFEYWIDTESKSGNFDYKLVVPEEWKPGTGNIQFSQLLLPTLDSTRAEVLIKLIANQPKPSLYSRCVLLVGATGTAKTSSVLMYSKQFKPEKTLFKRMNFSSATQPVHFQQFIETECDAKQGKNWGPPGNKELTVFIDDMSMPQVNEWGDQITLEIMRQFIEQGGFYYLEKNSRGQFRSTINTQFVGAMNHPGGGRNDIPNRLKRLFFIFNMIPPNNIDGIFGNIIKHFFKPKWFSNEFNKVVDGLTLATLKIWNKVKQTLLPTPNKFHYVFNLRDLSRIFKGVLQAKREVLNSASTIGGMKSEIFLIALWKHECERVFVDKLITSKDKDIVISFIQDVCIESYSQFESEVVEKIINAKPIHFCDFLRRDTVNEDGIVEVAAEKVYEAINDITALKNRVQEYLNGFNESFPDKKMDLVLFEDALKHLLRVSRIIKMPRSSALLVGVGGSGKQSLTYLAAYIGKHLTRKLNITKNYGEKDLKEEVKEYMNLTGHQNKIVTFILTDAEVKQESFLEYINMILSTGEISGLLQKDDKETWLGNVKTWMIKEAKERGQGNYDPPQSEVYQYFLDRLRDNLHIVLCFSPVGLKFRERARKFPALFAECTIDWFLPWPEEALISVADTFVSKFDKLDTTKETKAALQLHMANVHMMVNTVCDIYFQKLRRQVFVTPKSYLSFIASYKELYVKKYYEELDVQEKRFQIGLEKIRDAQVQIEKMSVGLKAEEEKVRIATARTDALVADLEKETKKAKAKQDNVEQIFRACQEKKAEIEAEKEKAQKDLDEAMPALRAAQNAVSSIKSSHIVELKTLKKVMDIMRYVLDCVNIILREQLIPIQIVPLGPYLKEGKDIKGLKDSYDEFGRSVLSDMSFLQRITAPEIGDTLTEETIELLDPYFQYKVDWFNAEKAKSASVAIEGLWQWVNALAIYFEKSKIVKPKIVNLQIQDGLLAEALANGAVVKAELDEINAFLDNLKAQYQKQIEEKNALEEQQRRTKKRIDQARRLIDSLSGEKDRWTKGRNEIAEQKKRLVGNSSMACAFISYCGPFNAEFRQLLLKEYFIADMKKKSIPYTTDLELTSFLIDDATIGEWNLQGLPKDDLSIQNGIMVTNSSRFPLLIDPQGQGGYWIRNKYVADIHPNHSIGTLQNPKFKDNCLRPCLEDGYCLIIEGIENEVDPMMDPVLEKQVSVKAKRKKIIVSGMEMDWHNNFKLFMTTKLPNPKFSPELSAKTTIIDFTVTQSGLEQQLLGRVLSKEQKQLEDSLNTLLTEVTQNKKNLQVLDRSLLEKLTSSQGDLLEDTELVDVLNTTKTEAKAVQAKLEEAEIKTKEINEKRELFRTVAIRGSVLYFTIIELSLISWMYNSSLAQYLELFDYSIDNSEKGVGAKRVQSIIDFLTYHVYRYINRGLFEKDKTTYKIMTCFNIKLRDDKINGSDVGFFLKGGDVTDKPKPIKQLGDEAWSNAVALSKHVFHKENTPFFKELPDSLSRNAPAWTDWLLSNKPEDAQVPEFSERFSNEKEMGPFLKLVLIRCLRTDRTQIEASTFIRETLNKTFTDPVADPIESIHAESKTITPVLFLLSAGADPTSAIDDYAKKKKKYPSDKVSMGEGQDKYARESLIKTMASGGWTILQNCHLGLKFMEDLDSNFAGLDVAAAHPDFRLFITSEPHQRFPLGLLQKCIKVTNEPPKGIKAGLHKTYSTLVNQDFLEKIEHNHWRNIVFTTCFLHSIVQERRKFGPLGWCVPYEYNNADLEASLLYVEKYMNNLMSNSGPNFNIQFGVIQYMVCQIQYGGKITDNLDRELFDAYGLEYLCDKILGTDYVFDKIGGDKNSANPFRYMIPQGTEISKFKDYIEKMPPVDNPEVFGLHPNADLTFRNKESKEMIDTILDTRPKESGGGSGKSKEDEVREKAQDYLSRLPPDYIDLEVRELVKKMGPGANNKNSTDRGMQVPLNIFLYQEISAMQKVIALVRKTLADVVEAIEGTIIMTPFLFDAINAIADMKVPNKWLYDASGAEISWMLMKLSSWFESLILRNNQLNTWLRNQRPATFFLGYFLNPQGFLTAMKQEVARNHKGLAPGQMPKPNESKDAWALDDMDYKTEVKDFDPAKDSNKEGVFVAGLWLESAKYEKGGLVDPSPIEKTNFFTLNSLRVYAEPVKPGDDNKDGTYNCPVYKYAKRTDKYLIFRVKLECGQQASSHWKLRGVALLCFIE